jgi:hypothetical protein
VAEEFDDYTSGSGGLSTTALAASGTPRLTHMGARPSAPEGSCNLRDVVPDMRGLAVGLWQLGVASTRGVASSPYSTVAVHRMLHLHSVGSSPFATVDRFLHRGGFILAMA